MIVFLLKKENGKRTTTPKAYRKRSKTFNHLNWVQNMYVAWNHCLFLQKKICNTSGEWLIVSKFLDFLLSEWKQMRISVYQKPLTHQPIRSITVLLTTDPERVIRDINTRYIFFLSPYGGSYIFFFSILILFCNDSCNRWYKTFGVPENLDRNFG